MIFRLCFYGNKLVKSAESSEWKFNFTSYNFRMKNKGKFKKSTPINMCCILLDSQLQPVKNVGFGKIILFISFAKIT